MNLGKPSHAPYWSFTLCHVIKTQSQCKRQHNHILVFYSQQSASKFTHHPTLGVKSYKLIRYLSWALGITICGLAPEFVSSGAQIKGFFKVNRLILDFGVPY